MLPEVILKAHPQIPKHSSIDTILGNALRHLTANATLSFRQFADSNETLAQLRSVQDGEKFTILWH